MERIESVIVGCEKNEIFFEFVLLFNKNKEEGQRGYYLKLIPVELSQSKKIKRRYTDASNNVLIIDTDRESRTKLKEARMIRDTYVSRIEKEIEEGSDFIEEVKGFMEQEKEREEYLDNRREERFSRRSKDEDKDFTPEKKVGVKFSDVAGLKEVKEELNEIVDYVKNKEKYDKMGAKLPKGILFYGPPGTGKTLFAKALAGETKSTFFNISGSEFTEKYVGVGAKRVRKLFEKARKQAPAIIFIDEIDAIGGKRTPDTNAEKDQTLNQLLVEMDGFQDSSNIIVIGATNRIELLDDALKRAGRFDRHIYIGNPDLESRKELFEIHTSNKPLDESVDLNSLAKKTHGFNGADIESIANESALLAIREGKDTISQENLEDALEKVIGGLKSKSKKMREKEKQIVSYHEAGHAMIGMLLGVNKIQKISIIPHGQALGFVINLPDEDSYLHTKEDLENEIKMLLAGRIAEEVKFGYYSTGASNDLKKATKIATGMVCNYGMGLKTGLMARDVYSAEKLTDIEREAINSILEEAYEETKVLLEENMDRLVKMAEYLYENEEMDAEDIEELFEEDVEMAIILGA